jgi:hypothetical protein
MTATPLFYLFIFFLKNKYLCFIFFIIYVYIIVMGTCLFPIECDVAD